VTTPDTANADTKLAIEFPASLQPLSAHLPNAEHIAAHARNTVKNVLDSYTGRFDLLAESIQNSMDALEKRWSSSKSFDAELPRIAIRLNADAEEITVTDNGVGIMSDDLLSALVPHMSPKSFDPEPTRGHKGVGTTFLAYGHPTFEIRTKTINTDEIAYKIVGGNTWVKATTLSTPPAFERVASRNELDDVSSGTVVRVGVGEETRFGRLKSAQYNKLATWALVLRTFTAVGTLTIGQPLHKRAAWLQNLRVELSLEGVAGAGTQTVELGFQLPHLDATSKMSLQQLGAGSVAPNKRFDLLYAEYDNDALELVLSAQLQELADSAAPEDQAILNAFREYETSVYASWSFKNTWYEDLYRARIGEEAKRYQYNNVRSGLLVTSVGMPIGEVNDHPYLTMKPEYKRRLFVIVGFNDRYSPDLGRKTIPSADRLLLQWLETQLQNLFLKHISRLIKSNDEAPHNAGSYSEAKEQLHSQVELLRTRSESRKKLGVNLGIDRGPLFEAELVAVFTSLVATDQLPGYRLIAIPGSATRYDALFDYVAPSFEPDNSENVPLGISDTKSTKNGFSRRGKWLEFKLRLEDLVDEFEAEDGSASKKYFDLLDLAVVWAVPEGDAVGDFELSKFDESSWHERTFYGSTHVMSKHSGEHRVEIICVNDLLVMLTKQPPGSD
jgi:hypothetical protein